MLARQEKSAFVGVGLGKYFRNGKLNEKKSRGRECRKLCVCVCVCAVVMVEDWRYDL